MTAFYLLPSLIRNLFQLWLLLLCFASVTGLVLACSRRQFGYIAAGLPCFGISYFLRQITLELSEFYRIGKGSVFCLKCGALPWVYFVVLSALATAVCVWLLCRIIQYNKHNVTLGSIKLCADSLPCGVCYWRDGGKVIFANHCMTELCFAVTGRALLNGEEFATAVNAPMLTVGKTVWSITSRSMEFHGAPLHELIAADVTELSAKNAALQAETEEISRYNEALRQYNLHIDDTVRSQEILQAKVNIHDEMNRLMLNTVAAGNEGGGSVRDAFALWKKNALLLCKEAADKDADGSSEELERIAQSLNMRLVWGGTIPGTLTPKQQSLVFSGIQEAMANAFKHASAKTMEVSFTENAQGVCCRISNDGCLPLQPVTFSGGLGNLRSLADLQGAVLDVTVTDRFTVSLFFPKTP